MTIISFLYFLGMKQSASTSVKGVETFDPWHRIDPHNFSDSVALSARESPFVRMTKLVLFAFIFVV